LFFDDGYQYVNSDSDPDLGLDSVSGRTIKGFDSEMLLDPFEKQFDLPTAVIKLCDGRKRFLEGKKWVTPRLSNSPMRKGRPCFLG
jgi:hypothetical protein